VQPTPGDVYINALLGNVSVAFMQDQDQYIADKVFPNVPVGLPGGTYRTYDQANWLRSDAQIRAPATESSGGGWTESTDTYATTVYAHHKDVDDQTLAAFNNAVAAGTELETAATLYVTQQLLLKREAIFLTKYFANSVWATDQTGSTTATTNQFIQWDLANSTPIQDVRNQIQAVGELTGYRPNTLILGPRVFEVLVNHTQILSRIQYTQAAFGSTELLARAFGVDRVLVPYVIQNTAAEGLTASYSYMYSRSALAVYAAPRPSLMAPSGGYTFSWDGYLGASAFGSRIKRFRIEDIASTRVEGEMAFDMKLVSSSLGRFFRTAVSTAA
jgi:hypothetical protein